MAERILMDELRPMSRTELVEELERRGVALPSEDNPRYLGTILWRNRDRFVNIPGKGYFLEKIMRPDDVVASREVNEMLGGDDDVKEAADTEDTHDEWVNEQTKTPP